MWNVLNRKQCMCVSLGDIPLMCFLGISSVINRNINSFDPYKQDIKSSKLLNISSNPHNPFNPSTMNAICIPLNTLWTRCASGKANLTATACTNHFVPLFLIPNKPLPIARLRKQKDIVEENQNYHMESMKSNIIGQKVPKIHVVKPQQNLITNMFFRHSTPACNPVIPLFTSISTSSSKPPLMLRNSSDHEVMSTSLVNAIEILSNATPSCVRYSYYCQPINPSCESSQWDSRTSN